MANFGSTWEPAQIASRSLLRRCQARHIAQIGGYCGGHFRWHGLPRNRLGLVSLAQNREAKGAGSPSGLVLPLQQRRQRLLHPFTVA